MGFHPAVIVGQEGEAHAVAGDDGLDVVEEDLQDFFDGFSFLDLEADMGEGLLLGRRKIPGEPFGLGKIS